MSRFFVVVDGMEVAEVLTDQLRRRGFLAEAVESTVSGMSFVDLGYMMPDGWKTSEQEDATLPRVVAADRGELRSMKSMGPNRLLTALRSLA
jgi:hypothetical protein